MSLLSQLMSEARKAEMGYGIHNDCIISNINNGPKYDKNQTLIERNTFITFQQVNKEGTTVAEKEIGWFNLKPDEYTYDNFSSQLEQLTGIVDAVCKPEDVVRWENYFEKLLTAFEIEVVPAEQVTVDKVLTLKEDLTLMFKNIVPIKNFMNQLTDGFVTLLTPYCGSNCPRLRVKLVFDSKGQYVQQPRYGIFVEAATTEPSKLQMSKQEESYYQKSLETPNTTAVTVNHANI